MLCYNNSIKVSNNRYHIHSQRIINSLFITQIKHYFQNINLMSFFVVCCCCCCVLLFRFLLLKIYEKSNFNPSAWLLILLLLIQMFTVNSRRFVKRLLLCRCLLFTNCFFFKKINSVGFISFIILNILIWIFFTFCFHFT